MLKIIIIQSEINIEFGEIYFSSPLIHENNGSTKLMYPNDARLRNLTYSAPISLDIKISLIDDPFGKKELLSKVIKKVNIGKIPIMIKSKYCLLNNNNTEVQKKNECKYDLGGYFIINGNEKVVVCQEKIAENKVYAVENQ